MDRSGLARLTGRFTNRRARANAMMALASLGLAVVIWFAITDAENELVEQPFGFSLAVETVNVPVDLIVASRVPPVSLTIAAREDDLDSIDVDDFQVTADLAGLTAGEYEVSVQVRSLSNDVRVRAVSPATVEVVLEPVVQRILPISVLIADAQPLGFERGDPSLSTDTVTINGTANLIDLVDRVVAPVDLSGATVDIELPVTLQPRTSTGAAVSGIRLDPPSVTVTVPIRQELFSRAVAVLPQIVGQPAANYHVVGITVDPVTVTVVGTLEALEAAAPVTTAPVSLGGRSDDLTTAVAARAPDGLTLESDITVTVRVQIEPVSAEVAFQTRVAVVGLATPDGAAVTPDSVEVLLAGPAPTLAEIGLQDLSVSVDATNLEPGAHRLPVQVGFLAGLEVVRVTPSVVLVTIAAPDGAQTSALDGPPDSASP